MSFSIEESDFSRALVHFIASCSGGRACWYSIKPISNDIPDLPKAMGLTYESSMYMFQCCGLATKRRDVNEWNFLSKKFAVFMTLFDLKNKTDMIASKVTVLEGADDATKKRKQCWFIRLGGEDIASIRFAGHKAMAPRIQGINAARATFQNTLWMLATKYQKVQESLAYTMFEKLILNQQESTTLSLNQHNPDLVVSDAGLILTSGTTSPTLASSNKPPATPPPPPPPPAPLLLDKTDSTRQTTNILLNHIRVHLLPLILEKEAIDKMESFWLPTVNESDIELALLSIVSSIQQKKEEKLSVILKTNQWELSPNTLGNTTKYPKLRQYGIPLNDKRVHEAILRDLYLIHKRSSAGASTTLSTSLPSGEERALIFIPKARTYRTMWRDREMDWFTNVLQTIGGGKSSAASTAQAVSFICHYLITKHKESFLEAVKLTGTQLVEPLDPIATFSLQSVCNLPASKMKLLKRFLEAEIGLKLFSTPTEIKKVIGMDSVLPLTGTFSYSGSTNIVDP